MRPKLTGIAVAAVLAGGTVGAGLVSPSAATPPRIIRVPQDFGTIQKAVNAAKPYDFILVGPGSYHEGVVVTTPHLTIRGVSRNRVIMEGDKQFDNAFRVQGANGVEIDNMIGRNYKQNAFFWDGVTGFKGTYLTAVDNYGYGIYAFRSTVGEFSFSYASGNGDSGFYIGACFDCKSLITNVHAQNNGLGYSGTNAGGILIQDSEWDNNVAGIVPSTLTSEDDMPQGGKVGVVITNNYVHDNQNATAPSTFQIGPLGAPLGMGIEIAGGWNNQIIKNKVRNQNHYGIVLHWLTTPTMNNQVQFNDVSNSGGADLAWDGLGTGNCFEENTDPAVTTSDPISGQQSPATQDPPTLQNLNGCGTPSSPLGGDPMAGLTVAMSAAGLGADAKHATGQPFPGPQDEMADVCLNAPPGCAATSAKVAQQGPVVVRVDPNLVNDRNGYTPIQSLVPIAQGTSRTPTVAELRAGLAAALANLAAQPVTVDVPAPQPDYYGYLATALGVAALFLFVGAGLGFWRRRSLAPAPSAPRSAPASGTARTKGTTRR